MRINKILKLILGTSFLFIVVFQIVSYFNNKNNYYIYENNRLNLSIKYPLSWEKTETNYSVEDVLTDVVRFNKKSKDTNNKEYTSGYLVIRAMKVSNTKLDDLYKKYLEVKLDNGKVYQIQNIEKIKINDIEAYTGIRFGEEKYNDMYVYNFVLENDIFYMITYLKYKNNVDKVTVEETQNIIKSIKFDYMSEKKGDYSFYKNEYYNVAIKYPTSWYQGYSNPQIFDVARFTDDQNINIGLISFQKENIKDLDGSKIYVESVLRAYYDNKYITLDDYKEDKIKYLGQDGYRIKITTDELDVNSVKKKMERTTKFIFKDNKIYGISYTILLNKDEDFVKYEESISHILDSFSVLN